MARRWIVLLYAALEIILALLAVFGLFSALWLLCRRAMFAQAGDQPGACAVVAARGDGSGLEQTVKELLWLRLGGARHYAVLIADAGLDPKGRAVAAALANSLPEVLLCPMERLTDYLDLL